MVLIVVSQLMSTMAGLSLLTNSPLQWLKVYPGAGKASIFTCVSASNEKTVEFAVNSSLFTFTVPPISLTFTVSMKGGADQPASAGLVLTANDKNNIKTIERPERLYFSILDMFVFPLPLTLVSSHAAKDPDNNDDYQQCPENDPDNDRH